MPIYYITNRFIVVGPEATVRWPRYSRVMDYELEIAIVTRRTRANIPEAEAGDHIFGYTIFNDFSARDRQRAGDGRAARAGQGQELRRRQCAGPVDRHARRTRRPADAQRRGARQRRDARARATTANMLFSFPQILAYASQDETIHAGEVFGSGTVGNCCGLEIGRFLQSGDTIELHVDRIGVLRNRVVAQD